MSSNTFRSGIKIILFGGALLCWAAGLLGIVHWSYNFQYDPDFLNLSQIRKSFFTVAVFYLGGGALFGIIVEEWLRRIRRSVVRVFSVALLSVLLIGTAIYARPSGPDCAEVRRHMKDSGVAYNAKEGGLLGGIKIDEPSGDRFSPDADQMAWWGKFHKPFEYWGSPDLTSHWFNPEGQQVASIKVDAEECKLAKAIIKQEGFQSGIWQVDVVCDQDGKLIDQKRFAVGYPPVIPADVQVLTGPASNQENQRIRV